MVFELNTYAFMRRYVLAILMPLVILGCDSPDSQQQTKPTALSLPSRPVGAPDGSSIASAVTGLTLEQREARIFDEIASGNVPAHLRDFVEVTFNREVGGASHEITFRVLPDYLAVGSDSNSLLFPISPVTAQRIADLTHTSLPTTVLVNTIWSKADTRVAPSPIPPSPQMTTVPVFASHNNTVQAQLEQAGAIPGRLVAGHKKDVVLTSTLDNLNSKVAIYGWHELDGDPIQPLYTGHTERWVDYSHGIRLIDRSVVIDGESYDIVDVLSDPTMADILNADGQIEKPYYSSTFTSEPLE